MTSRKPGRGAVFDARRVYDDPHPSDGRRVLVDRLWPRGLTKERARVDEWDKDLAPSNELRTWFHQAPEARFEEFARRYEKELDDPRRRERLRQLHDEAVHGPVTLVTGVKDVDRSHVPVLLARLRRIRAGQQQP